MPLSISEFFAEASRAEDEFKKAFKGKLESLSDDLLSMSKFREKLEEVLPSVAKHELSFGVFNNLAWCARRKARFEGDFEGTLEQARYLGLCFAFNYCADQIAKARHDYFRQVLEHGISIANSQCACYEATSTTMYSDFYSTALQNSQSEFRRFLLTETAKQRAKADVHGFSQSGSTK